MSSSSFRDEYFSRSELAVAETETHRCAVCSGISYEKFRADNPLADMFSPKTLIIGSFFTATDLRATVRFYEITAIGLRLSLDDELSLHCYDRDGYGFVLNDLTSDVIDLSDGEWSDERGSWIARLSASKLDWTHEDNSFPPILTEYSSRLIFNPNVENDRLLAIHSFSNCCKTHKQCPQISELPELPTRVLDIGAFGERQSSRLILSKGLRAEYVTLSHCWGKTHHTMSLTSENLQSMMAGIDDTEMPRTFHEAIMIARVLGQPYMWIDSMCIIQSTGDDSSVWEREGAKMAGIYRNSTLTIAASSANDNTEGCFFAKGASRFDVHPVPLFQEPLHRNWDPLSKIMKRSPEWFPMLHPKPASWLNHAQNSPLNKRSWVLQKRILSSRILHCTNQGFFWECAELRASEYEPLGCSFEYFYRDQGLLNIDKLLTLDKEEILGSRWRKIVEQYTLLGLTMPSDRLPTLSGLARTIQDHTNDQYVAGHWKSSLATSLLWFRLDQAKSGHTHDRNKAPSWSWASISSPVKFTYLETADHPSRDPEDFKITAEVVEVTAQPIGPNHLSWLSQSRLGIRGYLRDKSFAGGLPKMEPSQKKTSEAAWRGHKPIAADIGQLGAIEVNRTPQFISVSADNSGHEAIPLNDDDVVGENDDQDSNLSTMDGASDQVEELEIDMASVALDHDKLQVSTKQYMESMKSSREWKELVEADEKKNQDEAADNTEETIFATYDDIEAEAESMEGVALLEVIRSTVEIEASARQFCEGLILRKEDSRMNMSGLDSLGLRRQICLTSLWWWR